MHLTYLPAAPEDAAQIFALCRDLVMTYEDPMHTDISRALNWCRRKIQTGIDQYTRVLADGEVAAYYRFVPEDGGMELDDVYVLPPFRGRGIGTAIVEKCCRQTEGPIFLCVFKENTGAIRLYRRMGFEIAEEIGATRCIMRREVL